MTKRFERGQDGTRERVPVREATFSVAAGDVVALVGRGRSGRTTVLRLAAGIDLPSEGIVRFNGHELVDDRWLGVPGGIAYCTSRFSRVLAGPVYEHVGSALLGLTLKRSESAARVDGALERVGASACAEIDPRVLDHGEAIRVTLARAIVAKPKLLLVDDPVYGVDLKERDDILLLLHSLARDDGIAVFFTVGSGADLAGVNRSLSIDAGKIRGKTEPTTGHILPFRRSQPAP